MPPLERADWRNIVNGRIIPGEGGYCDQPYLLKTKAGHWLCVMTTNENEEGQERQHVVSSISWDQGQTWEPLVDIEPAGGPNSSWAISLLTPGGRIYVFYLYNGDHIALEKGKIARHDVAGWMCFRYSDDHGRSWSEQRYRVPIRQTAIDKRNVFQGQHQMFWSVCQPIVANDSVYIAFTKMAQQLRDEEGWFLHSPNILREEDPDKIEWETLPDGENGIRGEDMGIVQEEHQIVHLGERDFYCVFRTTLGYIAHSYSHDACHTWTEPEVARYSRTGKQIKNPTACPRMWTIDKDRHLLWFHNHSGKSVHEERRLVWLTGGVDHEGRMTWAQPELLYYHLADERGMSYPDLIRDGREMFIAETQKKKARVHEVDTALVEALFDQGVNMENVERGRAVVCGEREIAEGTFPSLNLAGLWDDRDFAIDLWLHLDNLAAGQLFLDTRDASGKGVTVGTTSQETVAITLNDGEHEFTWDTEPGIVPVGRPVHIVFNVDGGPRLVSVVVNGVLCDGGEHRQFGWAQFPPEMGDLWGGDELKLGPRVNGKLQRLWVYSRHLTTSEAIRNYQGAGIVSANEIPMMDGR